MNASHSHNRPRESRLLTILTLSAVTILFLGLVVFSGCTKPSSVTRGVDENHEQTADPWVEAGKRLRKETDPAACKAVIAQINGGLTARRDLPQLPTLAPASEQALTAIVLLKPEDLEEVRAPAYTTLDANYLADCLYFRDVARSLDHPGLTPARRAQSAFDWVCRQVYLHPWIIDLGPHAGQLVPAVPPTSILRRGSGSGLERAYVLLALLQQMHLDGCLIGPPDAGTKPAGFVVNGRDGKPLAGSAEGPFWSVGVRGDNEILLYDPWWSQPIPGSRPGTPATLSQVKANPDSLGVWIDSPNPVWGITREEVKNSAVFFTLPVSALSPRMAYFEEKLQGDLALNLAENPTALRERLHQNVPVGTAVAYWGETTDEFAYVRVASEFHPIEDGGRDREPATIRRSTLFIRSLLPKSVLELPVPIPDPAIERLHLGAQNSYAGAFLVPPTPRERLQRGQFHDAARYLTEKQDDFAKGLARLRQATPEQVLDWCKRARTVYTDLDRARRPAVDGPARPDTDPEVAAALNMVEQFWKIEGGTAQLIVDRATARAGLTESSYLFALAMHEKAEWVQLQSECAPAADANTARGAAMDAWKEANSAWRAYLDQTASLDPLSNRKSHAQTLAARATALYEHGKK